MMMTGQAPELENLMDTLVNMVMDDVFWEHWDSNMNSGATNGTENMIRMFAEDEYLSGMCGDISESNHLYCFTKLAAEMACSILEHAAEDLVEGDIEHEVEMIMEMIQGVEMMINEMLKVADMILEKHMIWCTIESVVTNMNEGMKTMMEQMMMNLEDEGPTAMMNNMIDTKLEMVKMVFGGDCPDGFWDNKQM